MAVTKLSQIVKLNGSFRNSINLYLNLNKKEKIDSYIPTKSSLNILKRYVGSVIKNKDHSTILIGSYGKGKSHLLLILLAIVSMQRTKENNEIVKSLLKKIRMVDEETFEIVSSVWNKKGRFLPVIISGSIDDVSRSFMIALNDALKRENLMNLMPDTFFSIAEDTICRWKKEYPEVYINYEKALKKNGVSINDIKNGLKVCDPKALEVFKSVYPSLMGGEQFNPLTGSEVLPMYQSVADKLREQYGYSGIYLVFDEFSKFIEGQEKHSIGGNMKFLQDMCELANESKDTQIYMTMVAHKSIKEYGAYLSEAVINAFTGIEGRIEEVLFNTSSKNSYELIQNAIETDTSRLAEIPEADKYFGRAKVDEYYKIPAFRSAFTNIDFEEIIVKGCYPLSPVSAYALLNISEKVAQNERTLFTFISKEEPKSIEKILSNYLENEFEQMGSHITIYYDGDKWVLDENICTSIAVDIVCNHFYSETVVINNELINKQYIKTAPIKKSRKIIMQNILDEGSVESYLSGTSSEATIYRAVMVNSGISSDDKPDNVKKLLGIFKSFFDSCVDEKKSLSILVNRFCGKPFGMRAGVLPILLAYSLSKRNEDIVVYYEDREIALDVDTIINMVDYPTKYSIFISKDSADKDRYLYNLYDLFADKADKNLSGNRIANILTCMQRWYRGLPQVTKNIRKGNEYISNERILKALPKLKNVMQRMDVNAYEVIFEILPNICGYEDYDKTVEFLSVLKTKLNGYMDWLLQKVTEVTKDIFRLDGKDDMIHTLKAWYEKQSDVAKHGLYNTSISGFMSCIGDIDTYDEYSVVQKIMKIVTEVHADSWNDDTYNEYVDKLQQLKNDIEAIGSENRKGSCVLSFTGKNGEVIQKYYDPVDSDEGTMFRNIIEDQLESFSDLDVNVRVAILLEMIEKVMRKEE